MPSVQPDQPRVFCHRCGMAFIVAAPCPQAELWRCPEKGCGLPFWSGGDPTAGNIVKCGVAPENADLFSASRPEMHRKRFLP